MFSQAARCGPEKKAHLWVQTPHNEWIYIKSENNKNETGSRYFQKISILPNGRVVLLFKIERRPRITPKTQDLNLNQTRNLQKIAPGPDLAARAKRLEITFIYRKGAEGPPTFTRGPVRARARARARGKYPGEKKILLTASSFRTENASKKFFRKKFSKKIFSPKFKKNH